MRRKHRRRHQGRLSRLASLARSLTASSAAGLLLALATLLVITPAQGNAQSATYRVTFQGKWTTSVTSGGLPSGAHFSPLIGAVHNDSVTFWSSGGTASAGVESMAEVGGTSALKSEINAAGSEASSTIERSGTVGATATVTVDITVSPTHPLVTLVTMIAPSPDWFVGVSGLSLLNAQNEWLASHTVDLFPYDAGTEDGTEFSLNNDATDPQGTITSIKGMGQFSSAPIATLTFTRQSVNTAPSFTSDTSFEVDENQTAAATVVAEDPDSVDEVAYAITGGADALKFDIGETTGVLTFKIPPNYESPADVASTDPLNDEGNNEYVVTVTATGGTGGRALTSEQTITVTVRNLEEAGTVSFSQVGAAIRATLSDPDGGVSSRSWQWARSSELSTGWTSIDGATSASYTPASDDEEMYLRAAVSYNDAQGSGKQAQGVSSSEIAPPDLQVDTLVSGLSIPWDIAFAPDGTMLFTQRGGVLSSRLTDGTVQTVTAEFGDLFASGETGLMGIVVDPSFTSNRRFYTCQGHTGPEIQVIAWTINAAYTVATRVADPLVGGMPTVSGRHGGCRLRLGPQGYLWIATGDAASGTVPQDLNSLGGKVLRVDASTGAGAPTNPFAPSRVYTYGHRNVQGLALRPGTSQMWSVEHGPSVDDEINLLVAGRNYGWDPVPGYNERVSMTDLVKFPDALEAKWSSGSPTLAASGGIFLEGEQWGVWEGRLAVATLRDSKLRLFEFTPDGAFVSQVIVPELNDAFGRLRTPMLGPDGALYVSTSNGGGADRILRIAEDTTAPTVSMVEISSHPGLDQTYAIGEAIEVTVTFSEAVLVTGTPQLTLKVGGLDRTAFYDRGSNSAALGFAYPVASGDLDIDGVSIEADSLSGGTIRDRSDNDAVLGHEALSPQASHKVDGVRPGLAASGGAVVDGTTLTLTYNEPLGSSTPEPGDFTVSGGDQTRTVSRVSASGSTVVLTLDVGAEHGETGIRVSYTPGNNPIRDVPGNDAEALSREPVTNDTPDTTPPAVSSLAITSNPGSDQTYAAGDEIEVTVRFSETVEVEGTPQLRLRVGTRTRTAGYDSGTGTAALVFGYEVAEGDEDTDGVSIDAGRIALNGGTIKDEAENTADLGHDGLATDAAHKVDGIRPSFQSAAVDGASLTLTYGEALDPGSRPASADFTVQVDGSGRSVSGVSISGSVVTLTLNPAVEHGDTGIRVNYTPGTNPIRDAVGNDARGLSSQSVTNTTGAPNTAPEFTSPSSFDVPENQALARRLAARDTDPGDEVTGWAIVGGADQGQFTITSDTGDLSFRTAPDYEAPRDNEYEVTVEVRSGAGARQLETEQAIAVRVADEREPPGIPEAPTFSGETAESMTVNWSEPENTGPPITDYDVQYQEGGSGGFTDAQHEGPGFALTLSDLKAGTVYEVQVRATNEEGTGDWSESGEGMTVTPLTVQMTPSPPPPVEAPFTMRFSFSEEVRGFTSGDIETQQEPACTDSANNPISCNPTIAALQTTDNRIFTTTVTPQTEEVKNNYTLTITVPANTVISVADSKPNEAATLQVRIAPPGVTVPISSLGLTASPGNGQVTLRWNVPENTGGSAIIRYEYRWTETGGEFSAWVSVDPSERSATVHNLTNGREYVFEVRGVNALGYGPVESAATPGGGKTPGGGGSGGGSTGGGGGSPRQTVPGAPTNLLADAGDAAVTLTWDAPEDDGGSAVTDYQYGINGRGWTAIGTTGTTHTVTGLVNDTVYAFQVRAVNRIGRSQVSLPAEATPRAAVALDFAHFANGTGITSGMVLVNVAPRPLRPAIYFYDRGGRLIDPDSVVDVTGDLEVTEDGALTVWTEMDPLGVLTISTHGQGELVSGSVKVLSDGPIGGLVRYSVPEIGVAGVGASEPVRDALFPARRQEGGIRTAAALHNLGEEAMGVRCRLMSGGVALEEVEIPLEANGQTSWFIEDTFTTTDTSDFLGSVRCTAPGRGRFTAIAVEMDAAQRIFNTLSVVPVDRTGGGGGETVLDFAHFVNGTWITDLVFVNLETQPSRPAPTPFHTDILPSRPEIYFYDTEGNPIAAASVVDITGDLEITEDGALTVRTEMEPLGVLTISTHGRGALVSGSVRVVSEGPIGGMLRFEHPDLGVAGVGASPPVSDVLFPVRRQEGGITTGVALHNLESSAGLVRCDLMREGVLLDGASIPLEANGQTAWLIDQAFPGTDTSDFVGSVRCDAVGEELFSAVALEMDPGTRIFTTLPVVPVPERPSQE